MTPFKLPRAIRLDPSDTFVFKRSAEPGEWVVPGGFLFDADNVEALDAKGRSAFRSGFLGLDSFGWTTLAVVVDATAAERDGAIMRLARQLVEQLGAPDFATAETAAAEEIAFAASLCDHPPQTILALHRTLENGEIRERFRTLTPREGPKGEGFRAFEFLEVDDDEPVTETVDLIALREKAAR